MSLYFLYISWDIHFGRVSKMKERKKKINAIVALVTSAIIILSVIVTITQYQVYNLTTTAKEKELLPLLVSISADKTSGIIPLEVSFTPIVSNSVGEIDCHWNFGDGNTSKETKPTYIYQENGTFICNLTVTDENGKRESSSVKIILTENHPPTVSIEAPTDKPRRPKIWVLEYILPKFLHIENFGCQDYWSLRNMGVLDPFFKGKESFFTVEAEASDQDGDEIKSYDWVLTGEDYPKRITKKVVEVKYNYSGKTIDIPTKDIYPARPYTLTLTVTDSAGKKRSETLPFTVLKSQDRIRWESFTGTLGHLKSKWISEWRTSIIMSGIILGPIAIILKIFQNYFPSLLSFPAGKLLFMFFVELILQTDPSKYTDETYNDVIERIVNKPRLIFKHLPEKIKTLLDLAENILEKFSESDWIKQNMPRLSQKFSSLSFIFQIFEEDMGLDNKRPVISNPFPESYSNNVPTNCPHVSITVEDPEGDPFCVIISGEYVINKTKTYINCTNNTFVASLTSLPKTHDIGWNVEVVDQNGKSGSYVDLEGEMFHRYRHEFKFKTLY